MIITKTKYYFFGDIVPALMRSSKDKTIKRLRASTQTYHLFCIQKKTTFSILHTHFYKIPTSIHLLYNIFYINNIFIFFFLILFYLPFLFPILPLLSSSFFFPYLSLPFPLYFSSSSFFFFLSRSDKHHHQNLEHLSNPPISVNTLSQAQQLSKPKSTNPYVAATMATVMNTSPIHWSPSALHHKHHNHQNPEGPIKTHITDPMITDHQSTSPTQIASPIHDPLSPIQQFCSGGWFCCWFFGWFFIFVVDFLFCVCGSVYIRGRKNMMRERMR